MPWKIANLLWLIAEVLFFAMFLSTLPAIAKTGGSELPNGPLILAALALAPFHTGFAVENMAIAALALASAALVCEQRRRRVLAGILLACALALKPTVACAVLIYLVVRKQWPTVLVAAAGCAALLLVAEARMMWAGTAWFASFLLNGKHLFATGTVYDFSSANPLRFDLVNAQVLFSQVLSPALAQYASLVMAIAALLVWLRFRERAHVQSPLLDLAIVSAVTLVPLYHRFHDAVLLIFPVAWAIAQLRGPAARYARISLAAAVPFLVPGAALLRYLADSNPVIGLLARSWWWNLFIAPHQAWMVLVILLALLAAQKKLATERMQLPSVVAAAEAA